ncbi:MAG: dihydrolipoyl dehydrogenase [Thermodesulfobacteriota bacterium]|nr:dihydrolipoyl dehydrogenase [Thermodesulfobacteriota bacterium]
MERRTFDLIVLGGGPGGYSSALRGAMKGLKVCLIEREKLGGTCLNWGCFPTKSLLHDSQLFSELRSSEYLEGEIKLRFEKVMERKDKVIHNLVNGIETILINRGVMFIQGNGRLVDSKNLIVKKKDGSEVTINGERMIISTGAVLDSSPFRTDGERILSSRDALSLKELPRGLAIVGCGRRGVEFGTIFRGFGCEVVLFEKGNRILQREDLEISHRLRRILTMQGIKVMVHTEAVDARISEKGRVILSLNTKKGLEQIEVEKVLIPGKRLGNIEDLGLENVGIVLEDGFIRVNEHLETSVSGVYGVGDVNGRGFLAHKALVEGILSVDQFTGKSMKIDLRLLPRCTYASPEIGSIGLTQKEAEERGEEIEVGKFPIAASGRAATIGQDQGVLKIVFGKRYGEILGVHILAPQATELISIASLAMRNEMGVEELKAAVYGHPTLSEAFFEAALDVKGEAIHFLKSGVEL